MPAAFPAASTKFKMSYKTDFFMTFLHVYIPWISLRIAIEHGGRTDRLPPWFYCLPSIRTGLMVISVHFPVALSEPADVVLRYLGSLTNTKEFDAESITCALTNAFFRFALHTY